MATRKHTAGPVAAFTLTIPPGLGRARKTFSAPSIAALVDAFERWRDETGFGASDIGARFAVLRDGVQVGHVAYNGRWSPEVLP
ncbi:MAG: hypothetical protein M0038_20695 [Pseudomonadota bacterium]|jgi:hypothetical protein|nr:hypothetical protein [Pseudomonadota bacterium]